MLDALNITEADAAGLSELAALDLAMARDFAARAQAAEDPDQANDLARSYQRMARSYRQSLALKTRLRAEMLRADREAPRPSAQVASVFNRAHELRADVRAEELHDAVSRVIWAEHEAAEPPEAEDDPRELCFERLEARLEQQVRDPRFALQPLDEQVMAMCRELGLDPGLARRWRDLPDPSDAASGESPAPPRRDSG